MRRRKFCKDCFEYLMILSLSLSDLGINKDDLDILDDYDIYKNDDGEARMMTEMSVMMMVTVFIS